MSKAVALRMFFLRWIELCSVDCVCLQNAAVLGKKSDLRMRGFRRMERVVFCGKRFSSTECILLFERETTDDTSKAFAS